MVDKLYIYGRYIIYFLLYTPNFESLFFFLAVKIQHALRALSFQLQVEDSIHDPEAASVEAWYREVWSFGKMWKNTCKNHTHTIHVWYI